MKKTLSMLLAASMILSTTAFAAKTDDMQSILSDVKTRIGDTDKYTDFDSSYSEEHGHKVYSFEWSAKEEDGLRSYMHISVNDSGLITDYSHSSDYGDSKATVNRMSNDASAKKAKELIDKLNPQFKDKFEIINTDETESLRGNGYNFDIQRIENGIPVYGEGGYLSVSADASEINYFSINYTEGLSFPSADGIIDKSAAQKQFAEKIGMELSYKTDYDYETRTRTPYLSYSPKYAFEKYIDAKTGEVIEPEYAERPMHSGRSESLMDSSGGGNSKGFSEAEIKEIEKIENIITPEQAENAVRSCNVLTLAKDAQLNSISLNKDSFDENGYSYNMRFKKDDIFSSAIVNAADGNIVSWSAWGNYDPDKKEKYNHETAKALADNALKVLIGNEISSGEYKLDEDCDNGYYSYTRYINDIPYDDNKITIGVDLVTGEISHFNISKYNLDFPSPDGVLDANQASDALFKHTEYRPIYYPCASDSKKGYNDKAELVYALDEYPELDAFTGEPKIEETAKIPEYTDISGHYAENAVNTLRNFGIGFAAAEFNPDESITQKDFIALVVSALKYNRDVVITDDFDYSDIYRDAIRSGIISKDEKDETSSVTREKAAVYFINTLGLGEVASFDSIYNCPFTDVSANKGYISILSAMKVLNGSGDGTFNPDGQLTRGAAMIMIYNYLSR